MSNSATGALARFHERLAETIRDENAHPVLIVAFGDSVTAGENEFDVYHAQLKTLLEERYPGSRIDIINSGVGGETSAGGLARIDSDVIAYQPDLVLVAFGLNDCGEDDLDGLPRFAANIEEIIDRIRDHTPASIMLLSTNMMPTHATDRIPEKWAHLTEHFIHLQNDGILKAYAQRLGEIAAEQNVAFADIYGGWEEAAAQGTDTTAQLVNGLNHPDAEGGRIAAAVLLKTIEAGAAG